MTQKNIEEKLKEDIKQKLKDGKISEELKNLINPCICPIYFLNQENKLCDNGTLTYIGKIGENNYFLTANHVLNGLSKYKECKIENSIPKIHSIFRDNKNDVAMIYINNTDFSKIEKKLNPITLAKQNDTPISGCGMLAAGYPGNIRTIKKDYIEFGFITISSAISSVNIDQITWRSEQEFQIETPNITTMPKQYNLQGTSGGPFLCAFDYSGIIIFKLCGIIKESSSELEYLCAARIDNKYIQEKSGLEF